MNVRKPVDYSIMFATLDALMAADLPQMALYCEIGQLVSGRPEKGAAVAAAEYLCGVYPDTSGFSPRNLRRMRELYRTYENNPEILAEAMTIGWTQNVVILEAELTLQERAWYIRASKQYGWSKLELTKKIQERAHESMVLDSEVDLCYSNGSGGGEDGTKETSGTFLQGMRDAEIQRELQRQGPCGSHLQSLFPPLSSTAGRTDDAPPSGKSAPAPFDRKRDDVAEKSNSRPPARGESLGLYGLCGAIPPLGKKSEKAGVVHPNADVEYRQQYQRSLWRSCVCQRELPSQPNTAAYCPHTAGWRTPDNRAAAQNLGEAVEMDSTYAGDFLVGRGLLQSCWYWARE